jgi:hypothetical protein
MSAKNPCPEMLIEVRSFQLRWAWGIELISAPCGYGRIISSCRHRISLQDLRYRNTQAGLSSACQTLVRDSLLDSFHRSPPMPRWAAALIFVIRTGAYPDFLLRGPQQRPRVRLSVRKAA